MVGLSRYNYKLLALQGDTMLLISCMEKGQFQKDVGQRLRELRGGKTQENICDELSRLLGSKRTKEAYQHYEAGRRLVPTDVLWGLSVIYGVSADWILRGKKQPAGYKQLPQIEKDIVSLAELILALPTEQRKAMRIIVRSMGKKSAR